MDVQVQERTEVAAPLAGRVAVVTGSTSGIGLGIARSLAAAGADVVINGLGKPDEIDRVLAELERDNPSCRTVYNNANLMHGEEGIPIHYHPNDWESSLREVLAGLTVRTDYQQYLLFDSPQIDPPIGDPMPMPRGGNSKAAQFR